MKFHKIIRESLAPHLADKSAVCAINRHLRFSQECANAPLSTMNVKKSFTLVQVYSSPFMRPPGEPIHPAGCNALGTAVRPLRPPVSSHCAYLKYIGANGRLKVKVLPLPGVLSTSMVP